MVLLLAVLALTLTACDLDDPEPEFYTLIIEMEGEGEILDKDGVVLLEDEDDYEELEAEEGIPVTLGAEAAADWLFEKWTGDISSTDSEEEIIMGEDKQVTAIFIEDEIVGIEIEQSVQMIEIDETFQFTAEAEYVDGTKIDVTEEANWSSDDPDVASVEYGLVEGHEEGLTTINVEYEEEEDSVSVEVEYVDPDIVELNISEGSQILNIGESFEFTAEAIYDDGSDEDVTNKADWVSSDPSVATVNDGYVHALKEGSTTIYAAYKGHEDHVSVTVLGP